MSKKLNDFYLLISCTRENDCSHKIFVQLFFHRSINLFVFIIFRPLIFSCCIPIIQHIKHNCQHKYAILAESICSAEKILKLATGEKNSIIFWIVVGCVIVLMKIGNKIYSFYWFPFFSAVFYVQLHMHVGKCHE